MSDDDDFMMEEDEDQDYDFDYEDDEQDEPDVDLENKYYNAKGTSCWHLPTAYTNGCLTLFATAKKEDDPEGALEDFQSVVDSEEEKGDW